MKLKNGSIKLLFTFIIFPLTFLGTMVAVYLAIYGSELPFEIAMKTQISDKKMLSVDQLRLYRATLLDSVRLLRGEIDSLDRQRSESRERTAVWSDSLSVLAGDKGALETEVATLQSNVDQLKAQIEDDKLARMRRIIKILESINEDQVDSMYVAGLDDEILKDILIIAKEPQAATILQQVRPSRAIRLLSDYINPELQ